MVLTSSPPDVLLDAPPLGHEHPRILTHPGGGTAAGDEIIEFAARYGLFLDPWQRNTIRWSMAERPDGRWAAAEVGLVVPRQNGKGSILEARELAGLFLLGEPRITHTAHEFKTASDGYKRIRKIIERSPDLARRVKRMPNSPVEKAIELHNGAILSFVARSGGSGRGFTGEVIILDEAYDLTDEHMDALGPTLTTADNPQVWYTSSAGKTHSATLARIRKRGMRGDARLAYMEWSVEEPDGRVLLDPDDEALVAQANPGFGVRFGRDYLSLERGQLSYQGRLRERLGIFDPVPDESGPFGEGVWQRLEAVVDIAGPPSFALEVAEDRSWSCVAAAGRSSDGTMVVDAAEYRPGVDWVVGRLAELARRRRESSVVVQPTSAAGALIADLVAARVRVVQAKAVDYAQACGTFYDLVVSGGLAHLGQPHLDVSVAGARQKPSSEAWVWDRRRSGLDISPLVAATLAVWGASQPPARGGRFVSI